jgi:spore germination protein YaaH
MAHSKSVKVIMTAVYFDGNGIHTVLTNISARQNLINNIIAKINTYQLDGVNVDFESVNTADRGTLMNSFMMELTQNVHSQLPGKEVSFAAPAVNWGGWDLVGLASSCDYLFIMGYDFYGSWSATTGPVAPISGGSYNINNTINVQYGSVIKNMPDKLILGVPYYGQKWNTQNNLAHSTVKNYISSTRFKDDQSLSQSYGVLWASDNQTPWYRYQQNGEWYQVWFDNDTSLGLKFQLAQSKNLRGVGMWALCYDGARPELWNELRKRFTVQSSVQSDRNNLPVELKLFQNFPNPFNPSTVISYQLPKNDYVSLKIYNVMGHEVAALVSEVQSSGLHNITWNANGLPSGVYYYKLTSGNMSDSKKLMILK